MKFSFIIKEIILLVIVAGSAKYSMGSEVAPEQNPPKIVLYEESALKSPREVLSGKITLKQALDEAFRFNPELAVTWYEIKASQGAVKQAGSLPNPLIFGEAEEFGGSGEYTGTEVMSSKVGVSQEIALGGKIQKRRRDAIESVKIADLEHQIKLAEVRALVESRFYEVWNLQENVALLLEQFELIQKVHETIEKRVKTGDRALLDLSRSEVELATARIDLERAQKEFDLARVRLAQCWGAETASFSAVLSSKASQMGQLKEETLKEGLKSSPSWRLLDARVNKAESAFELAKAERIPDVKIEGGIQHFSDSRDHAFFIGVEIPVPLLNRNQGAIEQAKALSLKADYEKRAGFLKLQISLKEAFRNFISAKQSVETLEFNIIPSARKAFDSMSKAYQSGAVDILDLLDALRTWTEVLKNRLELVSDYENSRIEINRLIGVGRS